MNKACAHGPGDRFLPKEGRITRPSGLLFVCLAAAVGLDFGCGTATESRTTQAAPESESECVSLGGTWGHFGSMQVEMCDLPTRDAARPCRNEGDCESLCITADSVSTGESVVGSCFSRSVTLGTCLNHVDGGAAQGVVCID